MNLALLGMHLILTAIFLTFACAGFTASVLATAGGPEGGSDHQAAKGFLAITIANVIAALLSWLVPAVYLSWVWLGVVAMIAVMVMYYRYVIYR